MRAGSNLLASASEEDRVEFAADVLANIKKLIRIADEPPGTQSKTWFLSHRSKGEGETSAYSESFLRLLADPVFCKTLVVRLPWDAARLLKAFSEEQPKTQVGRVFVHQLTREWLLSAESAGVGAIDWRTFSDAPELADAAFGDTYLNRHYLPWESLSASDLIKIDTGLMERIERAAKLTIDDHIRDRFSYQSYNTARLQENFEILSRQIFLLKKTEPDITPSANILGRSVKYDRRSDAHLLPVGEGHRRQGALCQRRHGVRLQRARFDRRARDFGAGEYGARVRRLRGQVLADGARDLGCDAAALRRPT